MDAGRPTADAVAVAMVSTTMVIASALERGWVREIGGVVATVSEIPDLQARVSKLRELGYRIAVDDLGAGYAGLSSFALLEPDMVKLDMSLVRNIHQSAVRQRMVASMVGLCRDLGNRVVTEGVETVAERDVLAALGCSLMQGYFFAKPAAPFPTVDWPARNG